MANNGNGGVNGRTSLARENLDDLAKLVHPIPSTQDGTCPHIQWMGEDLVHCPGEGEYKCQLQKYEYGEYGSGGNFDYHPCNATDHTTCPFYISTQKK